MMTISRVTGRRSRRRPRTRLRAVVFTVLLAVAVGGCDEGSDGGASHPTPRAHSVSESATTMSDSATNTPSRKRQTVSDTGVQLQVPAGWRVSQEANGPAADPPPQVGSSGTSGGLSLHSKDDPLGTTNDDAKSSLGAAASGAKNKKRLPDLKVNGATLYHVRYDTAGAWYDVYGTNVDGRSYTALWQFSKSDVSRAEVDKLINPVMATFKLTS